MKEVWLKPSLFSLKVFLIKWVFSCLKFVPALCIINLGMKSFPVGSIKGEVNNMKLKLGNCSVQFINLVTGCTEHNSLLSVNCTV